ncbi:MAG: beta-ketoacyl-[acyl-carrier-protein] synthase family protein [Spirochaetaceae bacterium]
MQEERIVVTGLGVFAPIGRNRHEFWDGLTSGTSGAGPITGFDATEFKSRIAAEISGFEPDRYLSKKRARRMSRFSQLASSAALQAVADAGLDLEAIDPMRVGTVIGSVDMVFAGGSEAAITPLTVNAYGCMGVLTSRNDDPAHASRPFDGERDGFLIGEGAAVMVLERESDARRRGAEIFACLAAAGMTADAYSVAIPEPDGRAAAAAMTMALREARLNPEDVDYINAHGTSTTANDRTETMAIKRALGDHAYTTAVSSTKSMIGHTLGAAGAVEAVATVLTLKHGVLPPTINYETPDPDCDLDYIPNEARESAARAALSNSFGFGGQNCSLLFTAV